MVLWLFKKKFLAIKFNYHIGTMHMKKELLKESGELYEIALVHKIEIYFVCYGLASGFIQSDRIV